MAAGVAIGSLSYNGGLGQHKPFVFSPFNSSKPMKMVERPWPLPRYASKSRSRRSRERAAYENAVHLERLAFHRGQG